MTVLRLRFALAVLFSTLFSTGAAAGHLEQAREKDRRLSMAIPVDAMPPVNRAAYIAGIREELAAHGYDPGPLDAAIRAYQHDAGLPVDGVATKELLDHLKFVLPKVYAARDPAGGQAPFHEIPRPAVPLAPQPGTGRMFWPDEVTSEPLPDLPPDLPDALPDALPDEATAAPPTDTPGVPPPAEMEQGRTIGGVVSQVQAALKRRGYYAGRVSGRFDPETSAAVRRFQEDQGLPVDGVINTTLLNALDQPAAPPRSEAPTPLHGQGGGGDESGETGNL